MNNTYSISKFFKSTGWQVTAQIYTMLLSLIVGSVTARYLGPSNYGLIGYGQSLISLFNTIASLGMGEIIINDLVNRPHEKSVIIGSALIMRFVSSIICIGLIDICVIALEPQNNSLRVITILQSIGLLLQSCDIFTYWFQAKMDFKYPAIGSMIASTMVSAWRIILLIRGTDVEWFAFSSCIQYLASGMVLLFIFTKQGNAKITISLKMMKNIFRRSYHFILSNLAIALYTQMDKIMLGKMLGETEVGLYTAAGTVAALWEFVPIAMINSAKVMIYKSYKDDKNLYEKQQSILFTGISILSLLVGMVFMLFGQYAIQILYGNAYKESVSALKILIWATGFAMIGTARGTTWIILNDLNKYVKYFVVISSATNIILNYILIPIKGITGAAVATLISQIMTSFIAPLFVKQTRSFIFLYFKSWRVSYLYLINMIQKLKH